MPTTDASREAATAFSCGRQPADPDAKHPRSREAATATVLPPLRGSRACWQSEPWANAHGYTLSPLRGFWLKIEYTDKSSC